MDDQNLMKVVQEHFGEEPEVLEVAMYALSTLMVTDAILRGMITKATEIRGIPPEAYALMREYDSGMTTNEFFAKNFAPIKLQLAMDDLKLNTMRSYVGFLETPEGQKEGIRQTYANSVRAILMSRFDVLTVIAFLWKGVKFAEEFDAKYRATIQLTPDYVKYFKAMGI